MAVLGEIPAMVMGYFIIDIPFFGRKKTMVLFFFICFLANLFSYFNFFFEPSLLIARFCFRAVSSMIYAYTTEVYKTNYRILGVGWASSMGRIGSLLMPFIVIPLFYYSTLSPFLAFSIFSAVSVYCSFTLPYDTTNKDLDTNPDFTYLNEN
jgi:MFS transporter, putative metabolite:H+ symporter